MVSAAKAAIDLHIPNKSLIVGKFEVQQSISSSLAPLSLGGERYHQCTPGTSWIVVLSFQQVLGWLKSPVRTSTCESEAAPTGL